MDGSRGERIAKAKEGLGIRSPRIAKAKEGLVEMQAALDQAERVVGAAARHVASRSTKGRERGGS